MNVALRRGRQTKERKLLEVRPLTREDLLKLKENRSNVPLIQQFRDTHHRMAMLFATGLRVKEIALRSGYSVSRVLQYSSDPAFQNLVAHYREQVTEQFKESVDDYFEIATSNMVKAERQIAEKLDEADEDGTLLPTRELIAISRDAADRFGYGKKQMNVNVNVDFAAQLEARIRNSEKVIEAKPVGSGGKHTPIVPSPTHTAVALPATSLPRATRGSMTNSLSPTFVRRKIG